MKTAVILPAAGAGRRFNGGDDGGDGPTKIELELVGKPAFLRAVELFVARPEVCEVLVAVHPDRLEAFRFRWGDRLQIHGVRVVAGGTVERWQTVARALAEVSAECTHVAVHDAARPMTSSALIDRVFAAAQQHAAVVPALPVADTLKRLEPASTEQAAEPDPLDAILGSAGKPTVQVQRVIETVPRANLAAVQTPQVFEIAVLRRAYAMIEQGKLDPANITDDASLIEALGEAVYAVAGEAANLKLTRAEDVELFEAILSRRQAAGNVERGRKQLFGDDDDE